MKPAVCRIIGVIAVAMIFSNTPVIAASYYAEVAAVYNKVKISGSEFNPYVTRIKLGMPLSKTVSVEGVFGNSMQDDEINGLKLEIEELAGVYLRYQNDNNYNGVSLYFFGGQSKTTIKNSAADGEEFEDFSWGIGMEERSQSLRKMIYTLEYIRYYDDSKLNITGISLGLRYDF